MKKLLKKKKICKNKAFDRNTVTTIINDCVKWDIFNEKLFNQYNILTSKGIQTRYFQVIYKRTDVKVIKEYLLIDVSDKNNIRCCSVSDNGNKDVSIVSDNESTQSKVKKTKVKESKLNNTLLSEIKISDVPETEKQFYTIALSFQNIIEDYLVKLKIKSTAKHKYTTWIDTIRLMFENDKRTVEEFREVAEYLKNEIPDNNGFSWKANIRSPDTLRKQFEKVLIKSRQKLTPKGSGIYRKIIEPNLMKI